jgi:hypothetical protein
MSRVSTINAKIVPKQADRDVQLDFNPDEQRVMKAS